MVRHQHRKEPQQRISLGEKLIRDTLLFAGIPRVEEVEVIAEYNPFFKKAGMPKVAESKPNKAVTEALARRETGFRRDALLSFWIAIFSNEYLELFGGYVGCFEYHSVWQQVAPTTGKVFVIEYQGC